MDENEEIKKEEKIINKEEKHCTFCKEHPLIKVLMVGVLIFLGAFCAFYTIIDWHFKTVFAPFFSPYPPTAQQVMQKDIRTMDNIMREDNIDNNKIIKFKELDECYKIIINLKTFDNDKNNIKISLEKNMITIFAHSLKKSNNQKQESYFQQSYSFAKNVDFTRMTKKVKGNHYIITIPIEDED